MKSPSFTKTLNPMLMALALTMAGLFWSANAEACSAKASFTFKNGTGGKVAFTNGSSTGSGKFKSLWDFNDKTSSKDANPNHTFAANGVYHVCLTVIDSTDSTCTASFCTYDTVTSVSSCTAHFVFAATKLAVALADSGSSAFYHKHSTIWNYGDGSSNGSGDYAYHTYSKAGTYSVCVTVYDSSTSCSAKYCNNITITNCNIVSSYTFGSAGNTFYFKSNSTTSAHTRYKWYFGDGSVDSTTGAGVSHKYTVTGTTEVVYLLIYDSSSGCTAYSSQTITLCPTKSDYTYKASGLTLAFAVDATNKSTVKYSWNFGDKSSLSDSHAPSHTFASGGTYNVCLTATDSITGCTSTTCTSLTVTGCSLTASFTDSISGHTVYFYGKTNASSHRRIGWYYGDGSSDSVTLDPKHTYGSSVSSESVTLRVYDSTTKCVYYATSTITICAAKSDFTDKINGLSVSFASDATNKSTVKYSWNFGDKSAVSTSAAPSHTFGANGTYSVCLTATDSTTGCSTTTCASISVTACTLTASFTDSISGHTVYFYGKTNASTHSKIIWFLGDGTTDSTSGINTHHTYASSVSTENVYMRVYDSTTKCLYYASNTITLCTALSDYVYYINGLTVAFGSDTKNKSTVKYLWDFNDKSDSRSATPTHTYASAGTYNVCLTVTDSMTGCSTTTCHSFTVTACNLTANITDSISGYTVYFYGTTNASSHVKYIWNLGDGTVDSAKGTGLHVSHTYASGSTTENVYFRVYDSTTKCLYYATKTITLTGCSLTANISDSVSGHTVYFYGSTNASKHVKYIWIFGDGTVDSSKTAGLAEKHTYASGDSIENVYFRVYDSTTKCLYYAAKTISLPVCSLSASFADSISNQKVTFYGKSNASAHSSIKWYFGDGGVDSTSGLHTSHTYASGIASENVYLRVYDSTTKCLTYYTATVYLSYCITGKVTTGKTAGYPARVYLIIYNPADSSLHAKDSTMTNSSGGYSFCGLKNDSTYYTKAALTTSNSYYKYFIPTYHNDATKWANAIKITIHTASDSGINIAMKLGTNPGGAGFIGGKISAGANKTGDPEAGVLVVLYDSNANPVAYTYSNAAGYYSFPGIAFGTYQVWGEVPGKVCYPATVTLNDTSTTDNNVNLSVNIKTVTADIKPMANMNIVTAHVYPNPVSNTLNLELNMKYAEPVNIKIYDVTGKVVSETNTNISGGVQNMQIDASSLTSGLYFLRMEMIKNNTLMEAQFVKAH